MIIFRRRENADTVSRRARAHVLRGRGMVARSVGSSSSAGGDDRVRRRPEHDNKLINLQLMLALVGWSLAHGDLWGAPAETRAPGGDYSIDRARRSAEGTAAPAEHHHPRRVSASQKHYHSRRVRKGHESHLDASQKLYHSR